MNWTKDVVPVQKPNKKQPTFQATIVEVSQKHAEGTRQPTSNLPTQGNKRYDRPKKGGSSEEVAFSGPGYCHRGGQDEEWERCEQGWSG